MQVFKYNHNISATKIPLVFQRVALNGAKVVFVGRVPRAHKASFISSRQVGEPCLTCIEQSRANTNRQTRAASLFLFSPTYAILLARSRRRIARAGSSTRDERRLVDDKGLRKRRCIDQGSPPGDSLAILHRASLLHRQTSG